MAGRPPFHHLGVLVGLILLWIRSDAIVRMVDPSEATIKETVIVHHVRESTSSENGRHKRDADGLPSFIEFDLHMQNGDLKTLKLEKNYRFDVGIPVYVMKNGKMVPFEVEHDSEWGIYTDRKHFASFIIHRGDASENNEYILNGVYQHKGTLMQIRPHYDDKTGRVKRQAFSRFRGRLAALTGVSIRSLSYLSADVGSPLDYGNDAEPMRRIPTFMFVNDTYTMGAGGHPHTSEPQHHRKKRRTGGTDNVVEVFLSVDNLDYNSFLTLAGGNTATAMANVMQWYAFQEQIVNSVYETYEDQSSTHCLTVRTIGILVGTVATDTPWFNDNTNNGFISASPALSDWGQGGRALFPTADNFIAMTGGNIFGSSSSTIGFAYVGGICTNTQSAQISENLRSVRTALEVSHELGHNLNAQHDSLSGCSDSNRFVMSASLGFPSLAQGSNPWTFSTCSGTTFDNRLNSGLSACLRTTPSSASILATSDLPGQTLEVDQQCQIFLESSTATFCRTIYASNSLDIEDRMCHLFYCGLAGSGTCSAAFALDYTSCGNKKWCIRGLCTEDLANAPARFNDCPAGDVPGVNCASLVSNNNCNQGNNRAFCCESCAIADGLTLATTPPSTPATTSPTPATTTPTPATTPPTPATTPPTPATTPPTPATTPPTPATTPPTPATTPPTPATTPPTPATTPPTPATTSPTPATTPPTPAANSPSTTTLVPTTEEALGNLLRTVTYVLFTGPLCSF